MGMTRAYRPGDEESGLATIHRAVELGITFLDTAEVYGPNTNEQLVGRAIAGRREQFEIATKFGFVIGPDVPSGRATDGTPENVRRACEGSLKRLGVDHIDLFYQHRVHPNVPIEETVGAMAGVPAESASWGCRRPRRRRSAAHTQRIRSLQFRVSTRCGRVIPRTRSWRRRARHRSCGLLAARTRLSHRPDPVARGPARATTGAAPTCGSRRTRRTTTCSSPTA